MPKNIIINWEKLYPESLLANVEPDFNLLYVICCKHLNDHYKNSIKQNLEILSNQLLSKIPEDKKNKIGNDLEYFSIIVQRRLTSSIDAMPEVNFKETCQKRSFVELLQRCEIDVIEQDNLKQKDLKKIKYRALNKKLEVLRRLSPLYGINETLITNNRQLNSELSWLSRLLNNIANTIKWIFNVNVNPSNTHYQEFVDRDLQVSKYLHSNIECTPSLVSVNISSNPGITTTSLPHETQRVEKISTTVSNKEKLAYESGYGRICREMREEQETLQRIYEFNDTRKEIKTIAEYVAIINHDNNKTSQINGRLRQDCQAIRDDCITIAKSVANEKEKEYKFKVQITTSILKKNLHGIDKNNFDSAFNAAIDEIQDILELDITDIHALLIKVIEYNEFNAFKNLISEIIAPPKSNHNQHNFFSEISESTKSITNNHKTQAMA